MIRRPQARLELVTMNQGHLNLRPKPCSASREFGAMKPINIIESVSCGEAPALTPGGRHVAQMGSSAVAVSIDTAAMRTPNYEAPNPAPCFVQHRHLDLCNYPVQFRARRRRGLRQPGCKFRRFLTYRHAPYRGRGDLRSSISPHPFSATTPHHRKAPSSSRQIPLNPTSSRRSSSSIKPCQISDTPEHVCPTSALLALPLSPARPTHPLTSLAAPPKAHSS